MLLIVCVYVCVCVCVCVCVVLPVVVYRGCCTRALHISRVWRLFFIDEIVLGSGNYYHTYFGAANFGKVASWNSALRQSPLLHQRRSVFTERSFDSRLTDLQLNHTTLNVGSVYISKQLLLFFQACTVKWCMHFNVP